MTTVTDIAYQIPIEGLVLDGGTVDLMTMTHRISRAFGFPPRGIPTSIFADIESILLLRLNGPCSKVVPADRSICLTCRLECKLGIVIEHMRTTTYVIDDVSGDVLLSSTRQRCFSHD